MKPLRLLCHVLTAFGLTVLPPSLTRARAASSIFDYDHRAPLMLVEVARETRDAALVRDITFIAADKPVKAYLVSPAAAPVEPQAAILFAHWLGEPSTTNRTEFLGEAVSLAQHGVVSLLVDAMWSEPQWYKQRIPEDDYGRSIHQVIELRRAMDLLLAQPGIDPQRVAFVGHDFGAMYGMIASAQDRRAKTYVFMTAVPRLTDWFLFAKQPKDVEAYRKQLAPLSPVNFIAKLAPASIFFQFAAHDKFVNADQAAELSTAAATRKQTATYDAGHDLQIPKAATERVAWLKQELALKN